MPSSCFKLLFGGRHTECAYYIETLCETKMDRPESSSSRSATRWFRLQTCFGLLCGLRRHDLRAARTWINTMYPESSLPGRYLKFVFWSLGQMWRHIPDTLAMTTFAAPVSRTPFWLTHANPLENHPWREHPDSRLPVRSHVVVIGAGFTGGSLA